jgi:hypothetical protein
VVKLVFEALVSPRLNLRPSPLRQKNISPPRLANLLGLDEPTTDSEADEVDYHDCEIEHD